MTADATKPPNRIERMASLAAHNIGKQAGVEGVLILVAYTEPNGVTGEPGSVAYKVGAGSYYAQYGLAAHWLNNESSGSDD